MWFGAEGEICIQPTKTTVNAEKLWLNQTRYLDYMSFEIVKYDVKYQEAVVDLWEKCGLVVLQNDPVEDIQRKLDFQPGLFFIGLLDGQVVGSVMVGYEGHRGWINYLAVLPNFQKKGLGKKLVDKAIVELRKLGCLKVNLQVRKSNTPVVEFYKHLGFKVEDRVRLGMRLRKRIVE